MTDPPSCPGCGARVASGAGGFCATCLLLSADVGVEIPSPVAGGDPLPCELLAVIGDTPRAVTYLAEQMWPVRRLVALKLFKTGGDSDRPPAARHAQSALRHPHIGYVLERGRLGRLPYVMTEYLAGGAVTSCHDRHHLGVASRLEALSAMCAALEFAHARGFLHGRVNESNVLCEGRSPFNVRVTDFESGDAETAGPGLVHAARVRVDLDGAVNLARSLLRIPAAPPSLQRIVQECGGRARSAQELCEAFERLRATCQER
jgi:hypothetical protein